MDKPISNREKCMKRARIWLNCLRREEYPYTLYMQFLRDEVKDGCFTLQDIGTSEKELEGLCKKGAGVAAKVWLDHIKESPDHSRCARFLTEEIRKGNLTPTDIGITIDELSQLAPMAASIITKRK